jgi:hypothetical protein
MRSKRLLLSLIALPAVAGMLSRAAENSEGPAFSFREVSYFHRWSSNDQHEFTPAKQEDLDHWADMITVNQYPNVHDGDGLAATANAVLENYKSNQGRVLKTDSVPRAADRPAEHFIAVMFTRPAFIEIAFARFQLVDNEGRSLVYSHRFYGDKIGEQASAWLEANGPKIEKALMEWSFPSASLR